jgi:hypothetical protein
VWNKVVHSVKSEYLKQFDKIRSVNKFELCHTVHEHHNNLT